MKEYLEEVSKEYVSTPEASRDTLTRFFLNLLRELGYDVTVEYKDDREAGKRMIRARWEE